MVSTDVDGQIRHLVSERFVKELDRLERDRGDVALRVAGIVTDLVGGSRRFRASRVQGARVDLLSVRASRSYRVVQWRPDAGRSVVASVRHRREVYRWASTYRGDPPDRLLPVAACPLVGVTGGDKAPLPPAPVTQAPVPRRSVDDPVPLSVPQDLLEIAGRGLDAYMAVLSREQADLLSRTHRGLRIIRGPAGSGKTTLALHWVQRARDEQVAGGGVVYLCYNRVLRDHAEQMLRYLYHGDVPGTLECWNIDGWCWAYLSSRGVVGPGGKYDLDPEGVEGDLERAWSGLRDVDRKALLGHPLSFWREEMEIVILGRHVKTRGGYLEQDRSGRRSPLGSTQRRSLWNLYGAWRWRSETRRRIGFEHLAGLTLDELERDPDFEPYLAVVLDEVQDLSMAHIRVALRVAGGHQDRLAIFGDAAQRLYQRGFRWKDARLQVRGGIVRILRACHRSGRRVFAAADVLLRPLRERDRDEYDLPRGFAFDGQRPVLIICERQMVPVVAGIEVQGALDMGISTPLVAVLAPHHRDLETITRSFRDSHIPAQYFREAGRRVELSGDGVKLVTIHSAKGMGFPWVVLVFPDAGENQHEDALRHLLFTGMTRAGVGLSIICPEPVHPLARELIGSGLVDLRSGS